MKQPSLTQLVQSCLKLYDWPQGLFVDMTAGNGHDAIFMANQFIADTSNHLVLIDVQQAAIENCKKVFLQKFGSDDSSTFHFMQQVHMYHSCHSQVNHIVHEVAEQQKCLPQVALAMFNLGYLPGSNKQIKTYLSSTLAALNQLHPLVAPGGAISLIIYTNHPGGLEEAEGVAEQLNSWPKDQWAVWKMQRIDCEHAPFWLYAVKKHLKK